MHLKKKLGRTLLSLLLVLSMVFVHPALLTVANAEEGRNYGIDIRSTTVFAVPNSIAEMEVYIDLPDSYKVSRYGQSNGDGSTTWRYAFDCPVIASDIEMARPGAYIVDNFPASFEERFYIGEKTGTCLIGIATPDGKYSDVCELHVYPSNTDELVLNAYTRVIRQGEKFKLDCCVIKGGYANPYYEYEFISSNPNVATVAADGTITAVAPGQANINVRNPDTGYTATCVVNVISVAVESVSLSKTTLSMVAGDEVSLSATVSPANATHKAIIWTSSNPSVASVDVGGEVSAISAGTTTITARTLNGKTASCTVTVSPAVATAVSLSKTTHTMFIGDTTSLTATVSPTVTIDKTVTWTSGNPSIAMVDANGLVTANNVGTTTITATTSNGKAANCVVTVSAVEAFSISLDKTPDSLLAGDAVLLSATISPANTTDKTIAWSSSKPSVATVNANGFVSAKAVGTTTITAATHNGKTVSCTVTVLPVKATSVSLNTTSLSLLAGDKASLSATISPANTTDKTVTWTSNNPSIATVDANGLVTAKEAGTTTITATTRSGKSASSTITVRQFMFPNDTYTVRVGDILRPTVTCAERLCDYSDGIVYTSSDANVISFKNASPLDTVSFLFEGSGLTMKEYTQPLYAKKPGVATVTISTPQGQQANSITVTVLAIEATAVFLNKTTHAMFIGDTTSLTTTVRPTNTTDKTITWSSSKPSVATVDANGLVTAKEAGTTTITATTNNGKTAACIISVSPVVATSVSLDKSTHSMAVGETTSLAATISPANTTDQTLAWSSSKPSVATVNTDGEIVAKAVGTTTITVFTHNGKTAKCTVTVSAPVGVSSVALNKTTHSMVAGDKASLIATVSPARSANTSISWSSSKPSVATVDANGLVTAKGAGTTTVTATTSNGKTASCTVTVYHQTRSAALNAGGSVWVGKPNEVVGGANLIVKNSGTGSAAYYTRKAYAKFYIAGMERYAENNGLEIESVYLSIPAATNKQVSGTRTIYAHQVDSNNWSASKLKYSNAPAIGQQLGSAAINANTAYGSNYAAKTIDVTDYVLSKMESGDTASFAFAVSRCGGENINIPKDAVRLVAVYKMAE